MDEMAGVRKKLERDVGKLPDYIWDNVYIQTVADEYLNRAIEEEQREDAWFGLVQGANERLDIWNMAQAEAPQGLSRGALRGRREAHEVSPRGQEGSGGEFEPDSFVAPATTAMVEAMSEFFAGRAHHHRKVREFRRKVLPAGRFLTEDEAHTLIASCAARILPFEKFAEWDIPFLNHHAEVLGEASGEQFNPLDHWTTIRVDPPGITKTVRYTYPRDEDDKDPNTWYVPHNGTVIPIITDLPQEWHGEHVYPSWLWPGSVVDQLYELSVELAEAFDWPDTTAASLWRPKNESAVRFILTGEAPEVRPIDARWEIKSGIRGQKPQWRIQLTIPPWLPSEEVKRVYQLMQKQILVGKKLPKTTTPLEIARFVWEQERLHRGSRPTWRVLMERWNEKHPGHRFRSYNNFRMYFTRGVKAVKELNFTWPQPKQEDHPSE